jgi:hypothetical protein
MLRKIKATNDRFSFARTVSKKIFAISLFAAVLLLGRVASADTITPTGVDTTRGEYNVYIQQNGVNVNTYFAGVIFISLIDTNNQVFNRDTLCVDLFTDIYLNTTYGTTVLSPDQVPGKNLDRVSWLIDNALLPTQNNTYTSDLPSSNWVTTAAQGAGIQLAIWDIVEDNGDGFSSGSVQASSDSNHPTPADVLSWANIYESASLGESSDLAYVYNNVSLSDDHSPAQMLEGPLFQDGGPAPPTPEPSTFALASTVLIAARFICRKNAR